jgi:hypothetical protein
VDLGTVDIVAMRPVRTHIVNCMGKSEVGHCGPRLPDSIDEL